MKRNIILTADGSTTIRIEDWNEQYHSKHGAVQEAYHVFLHNGFYHLVQNHISILEMGFGTGLNALITFTEAQKSNIEVRYVGIEAFPVLETELSQLNYVEQLEDKTLIEVFSKMHTLSWGQPHKMNTYFYFEKRQKDFFKVEAFEEFDLVYFDAFGPRVQPQLWTVTLFKKMFDALRVNGCLVTYSAKGSVRRALQEVGFIVERLPGPPGKREMLRACKVSG